MSAAQWHTIFITGGGSGIGAGLARALHARGGQVIIGGRTLESLQAVAATCPGMQTCLVDVADPTSVKAAAEKVAERWPRLDTVINNAGIQRILRFDGVGTLDPIQLTEEVDTNLKGALWVVNAFLPLLRRQPRARLINVSSGLAFVPLVAAPVYSATKAAVHAFTVALREQLHGSSVQVVELIPPLVETSLHRNQAQRPPGAMPLDQFVAEAMRGLDSGKDEVAVGRAGLLRIGARVVPSAFLKIVNRKPRQNVQ